MEFRILGPLEIDAGGELLALGSAQQRAVLALLLVQAPEPALPERLIDELWGERPPETAQHAVQVYVSRIRKILRTGGGGVAVRSSPSGYVLDLDPERVDAKRFERLLGEAQSILADDPSRAREPFGEALGLWRGSPLAEFSQFEFARGEADRLEELRVIAVEGLVEARLACGEHGEVIGAITGLVAANPLRERPRRLLMLALYRGGRHAEALAAYRDACAALDEIGLQPGPELRALEQAILNHDATLAPRLATDDTSDDESADRVSAGTPGDRSRGLPVSGRITMLFTDIEGSTGLADRLGDRYPELLAEHDGLLREAIDATGGREVSTAGDSFFAAFADAAAALDSAFRAQRSLAAASWPEGEAVRVRMGIHTGAPTSQDGTYVGIDVHCAARVMALAHGGQVLLTQATLDALPSAGEVLDLGHHRLKDLPAPVHLFQAVAGDLPREFPPPRSFSNSNLPAVLHRLIGRSSEVSNALQLLDRSDVRLVTLLGPGGAGKTRLALEIAAEAVARYRDGAWFVSLAALADPSLIACEIAQTLGVRESEGRWLDLTLADFLARRELLVILDNFEHLLDGAGLVSRLLEAAPALDVLVTSRAPLNVRGEHRMQVAPLAPADAAELFVERARAVRSDAIQEPDDHPAVDRICQRLDRVPLALELAAARVAVFSVSALETRLAERLDLPPGARDLPDRQRTLRATIDWSHQLLSPAEQALFRDLAVFAGGARLDAIQGVCSVPEVEPTQLVAALIDKSLLRRRDDPDGEPRFWMLETIRQYATERLATAKIAEEIVTKHATHYLNLAEKMEQLIPTSEQRVTLALLESDHDNLRAAFDHLIKTDPATAIRMAGALGFFWDIHGHHSEARAKLVRVLESPLADGAAAAKAHFFLARLAMFRGDYAEAAPLLEQALHLAREAALHRYEVLSITNLAMVALFAGRRDRSTELSEEALQIARAGGDEWALRAALNALGDRMLEIGQCERARIMLTEALTLSRHLSDPMATAQTGLNLAVLALEEGALQTADALITESLQSARDIDYPAILASALALDAVLAVYREEYERASERITESLKFVRACDHVGAATMLLTAAAPLAAVREDPLLAAHLWAAYEAAMARLGLKRDNGAKRLRDKWLPQARQSADPTAWQNAWEAGAKLTPRQALDLLDTQAPISP